MFGDRWKIDLFVAIRVFPTRNQKVLATFEQYPHQTVTS
jgi:hypothetical protein